MIMSVLYCNVKMHPKALSFVQQKADCMLLFVMIDMMLKRVTVVMYSDVCGASC